MFVLRRRLGSQHQPYEYEIVWMEDGSLLHPNEVQHLRAPLLDRPGVNQR